MEYALSLTTTSLPIPPSKHSATTRGRKSLIIRAAVSNPAAKTLTLDQTTVTFTGTSSAAEGAPLRMASPDSLQYDEGYLGAVPARRADTSSEGLVKAMRYLTNILSSKVYDIISTETPLHLAPSLSRRIGVRLWLKREDLSSVIVSLIHAYPYFTIFMTACMFVWLLFLHIL